MYSCTSLFGFGNEIAHHRHKEDFITEPLFTSKADRERLTQMMFESFNVSGLYIAEQPVAALYAVGKVTGVSVDGATALATKNSDVSEMYLYSKS